jgi:hypothetical protein
MRRCITLGQHDIADLQRLEGQRKALVSEELRVS